MSLFEFTSEVSRAVSPMYNDHPSVLALDQEGSGQCASVVSDPCGSDGPPETNYLTPWQGLLPLHLTHQLPTETTGH